MNSLGNSFEGQNKSKPAYLFQQHRLQGRIEFFANVLEKNRLTELNGVLKRSYIVRAEFNDL